MIRYTEELQKLIRRFYEVPEVDKLRSSADTQKIKLHNALGNVPFVYEKIRGSMSSKYREERFIFKAAIFRILNRRIQGGDKDNLHIAEGLLKELIWAKYLPNDAIAKEEIAALAKIIAKYQSILSNLTLQPMDRGGYVKWLIEVMASEVEDQIFPLAHQREDAMLLYTYRSLVERIDNQDTRFQHITEAELRLQLKIQIHRIINKADFGDINLRLLEEKYPGFRHGQEIVMETIALDIVEIKKGIDQFLKSKFAEKLAGLIKRQSSIFIIIRDLLEECEDVGEAQIIFSENEEIFDTAVNTAIQRRIESAKNNLNRSVSRTVLLILCTRLFAALLVEFYLSESSDYFVIALNVSFPVILLLGVAHSIRFPDNKNRIQLIANIKEVLDVDTERRRLILRRPYNAQLFMIFQIFSIFTFVLTYGVIVWLLMYLNFTILHIITSLLFISIVSFFAVRITENTRQLMVVERAVGPIGLLFDIFTLPIIKAGKVVSSEFDRWNVFVFIMDYIIEAPFKNILHVTDEWVSFMREQKDEIY
jgi:nitrate reductase NapE component